MDALLGNLIALACMAAWAAIPVLLLYGVVYGLGAKAEKKLAAKRRTDSDKEDQPDWTSEDNAVAAMRMEANNLNQETRKMQQENEAEKTRQELERDRPFRLIRKQKATEYFALLVAESHSKVYGEGVQFEIRLAMKKLSDFATDRINLDEAELREVWKLLQSIKTDWKSVEISGFARKERVREGKEKDESDRRREEADDLCYEIGMLREEAKNIQDGADLTQGRILEEQKKTNEMMEKTRRGY